MTTVSLTGRRALVTGAASGIGLAVARRLAERGADVVVTDLEGDRLTSAAREVGAADAVGADLCNRADVERLVASAGDVAILVNNAGFQRMAPVEEMPVEEWDRLVEVLLTVPFLLCRGLLPAMYAAGWGRIVNIASVHGLVASPFKAPYVSAKHGIVGLTKVLALEAGARCPDVTAHAICPSYVRTPLVENQIADQARLNDMREDEALEKLMLTANAVKRLIEPETVADAVEMLCGDAAWAMSGTALALDAGWLAH